MCHKQKIVRENVVIRQDITNTSSFQTPIFLDLIPNEMRVKYCDTDNANTGENLVYSSLVNDIVGDVLGGDAFKTVVWDLNKAVRGNFEFQIRNFADTPVADQAGGNLVMVIEFIAYV